ncbi:cell wall hydrolase [Brevundimonas sp. NIBR11]|uniref:cell wall hydrolase n=1 Tax=Brevundimonas sp. NIBR11 TaxID=3015999 RepID=UPI0022F0A2C8|nr:cell wall hydrolase [Brevundimonas sp. NIBR11]WGM32891.1 hypothetical protein KKHFBJBL_03147 [Brevundimonas sp. NIBR11]
MMIRTLALAACLAVMGAAPAGAAQMRKPPADQADQLLPAQPAPGNDGEAYHRADDAEQDPAEVRTTRALNDEIAAQNALAENQERADREAFEAERARYEATVTASTQAQLAYEEDVRRSNAAQSDWQAEQARWQAERARWEADVEACRRGDRTRCAPPR